MMYRRGKTKKIVAMCLAMAMSITTCPVFKMETVVSASENINSTDGEYLYTILDDGTVSISGYLGEKLYVEIPSSIDGIPVTHIKEEAFAYNDNIHTIFIPESIISIGNSAFYHCTNLKAIALGGAVQNWGFTAVEGSNSLRKVFSIKNDSLSVFCSIVVNDLGEERARAVEIAEYGDIDSLKNEYATYINSIQQENMVPESTTLSIPETAQNESVVLETEKTDNIEDIDSNISEMQETASVGSDMPESIEPLEMNSDFENIASSVAFEESFSDSAEEQYTEAEDILQTEKDTQSDDHQVLSEEVHSLAQEFDTSAEDIATASAVVAEGTCGDNLIWKLDENNTLTISGTGNMYNYQAGNDAPWLSYKENIEAIVIENGVTSIGADAFLGHSKLTELVIGEAVTSIGNSAFAGCSELTGKLVIPDRVTSIGTSAFSGCSKLTGLMLGEEVTSIGSSAFNGCSGMMGELVIPDSVTSVGNSAFYNCSGFTGISLGNGITQIDGYAFSGCSGITGELVIPDGLKTISAGVFERMSGITSIVIGEKVESIYTYYNGDHAFYNMTSVKEITFKGLTVPSLRNGYSPFRNMTKLETVYVPAGVYSAYASAYKSYLPDGVRIKSIGAVGDFQIDDGVLTAYFGDGGEVVIPEGVTKIGTAAFQNCTGLVKVTMPDSVAEIGISAFQNCTGLSEVELSSNLVQIGESAFSGCSNLQKIELPEKLEKIGISAFSSCSGITGELVIPDSVTSIGTSAFWSCSKLTGLTIGEGVIRIDDSAFAGCSGLTGELVIPDSVTSIGTSAFSGCNKLTGLTLGEGVTSIGSSAFNGCSGMTGELVIPDSVTSVGNSAFYNCSGFTGISLGNGIIGIDSYAFSGCSGMTGELVIPDGLKVISEGVFGGMSGITSVVMGESVESVYTHYYDSYNAFYNMTSVKEITFKGLTVPKLQYSSYSPFRYMAKLETVYVPADSYDAYVSVYSKYVNDSVVFSSDSLNMNIQNFAAKNIYSKTVVLTWNSHTSERVVGYRIERDGEVIGETTECSFVDRNLITGNMYVYSVYGYTENNEITGAASITVTPEKPRILDIKTGNAQNKVGVKNTISIHVYDNGNLQEFEQRKTEVKLYYLRGEERVFIGNAVFSKSLGNKNAVYTVEWDTSSVEDGKYQLVCNVQDIDETTCGYEKTVYVDHSVPAKIVGVMAIGDITVIKLNWAISSEVDTTTYRIYRRSESDESFRLIAQINDRNTLTYTDKNVQTDKVYYYYVVGINGFGQEGEASEVTGATLSSDTEIPVVTKLSPVNASFLSGTVEIQLTAQDNVSVIRSELQYSIDEGVNWTQLGEGTSGKLSVSMDTRKFSDGEIRIRGFAYDAAGNKSEPLTYVYRIDNTGPEQVKGLTYSSTDITVTLSWSDVSDEDISFYRVERREANGVYSVVTDVYGTLGVNIYDLVPDNSYVYRVVGYDTQENRGEPSEDLVVTTLCDEIAPVITMIRPTAGRYSNSIELSVVATDEYSVNNVAIQVTIDGTIWNTVYEKAYTDIEKSRTVSYVLSLQDYQEGSLFVRAIATDKAGNVSDTSEKAPCVQYIVDRTAPKAPENVKADGKNGYIEVSWVQGEEEDLGQYSVFRADSEDGIFELIKDGIKAINYIDRDVEAGQVYYYKILVNDVAGNVSDYSDIVSAKSVDDIKAPEIVSIYPETGSRVGPERKSVSVLAKDDSKLQSVLIEYSKDGTVYNELSKISGIDTYSKNVVATLPVDQFENNETVYIRVSATDKAGNISDAVITEYVVDTIAPVVDTVSATYEDESVCIHWTGKQEADLIGYRIYRKIGSKGNYSLIAQRQVIEGQANYYCYDYDLSKEKNTYSYKVESVDQCGNVSSAMTPEVKIPDRSAPNPIISCDAVFEVGVEYYIDAALSTDNSAIVSYLFDFGDGTTSTEQRPKHSYSEIGEYTISLTVTDDDGNEATCSKLITVRDRTLLGNVKIHITDENGVSVPGAPVYFDLGEENQIIRKTDASGYVTFKAEVGKHTIGCVIADNKWLPVKKDIIITSGEETAVSMTLVHHVMIEGMFEITRMTFDEIVAAGIDVSKPENQYMVNVTMKLVYESQSVETSFQYNETTGETIAEPTIVSTPDGQKHQIIPVVLGPNTKANSGEGGGGHHLDGSGGTDYSFSSETSIAYLDIPVGVSTLKDFFSVNLHIINNAASEFSMLDNMVQLNIPDGLALVESYTSEKSNVVGISEIKGQTTETITWVLRGDQIGEYYLTADYSGILAKFNEAISTKFVATEPIKVCGLSGMKLTMEIPEELDHGTLYYNVSLSNEGSTEVYRPDIDTGDVLIETELYDVTGKNLSDSFVLSAKDINKYGFSTSIEGVMDVFPPGYRMTKHYMCVDQTLYTESEQKLKDYAYQVQNTYGMEVEIIKRPLSYFKEFLSADINAADKADLTFTTNQNAFDYLMSNENYIYWSMYASTGEVATKLTTNGQETLWNLLKFAAGDGDFKALFGADDDKLIQQIILDAMDKSVTSSSDYSGYYLVCDWTKLVKDWAKKEGHGEWVNLVAGWIKKQIDGIAEEELSNLAEKIGDSLCRTFEMVDDGCRWEAYKAIYEGEYLDFDKFLISKWTDTIDQNEIAHWNLWSETNASTLLHKLFSSDGFKDVWKGIGYGLKIAKGIVAAAEKTETDVSLFIIAQNDLTNCNLFLDTISTFMDDESSDAKKVKRVAEDIKGKMNELNIAGSFIENILKEETWIAIKMGTKATTKALAKSLGLSANVYVKVIKMSFKLIEYIGKDVFNVEKRNDIADNIRFVSCITIALRNGIVDAQTNYQQNKTDENAKRYMQLISYLLNIRAIGESQVAQFGITYEVLPGIFDGSDLLKAVKSMSGIETVTSWIEWRDIIEDRISTLRVQLLKNPKVTNVSGLKAPIVTFDYSKGQTAQVFSNEYEYSLDEGKTWVTCNGTAISVVTDTYVKLLVRRINGGDSNEKMTGSVNIYPAPTLSGSGIRVYQTKEGYSVANLDNHRKYEITFAHSRQNYKYGDTLEITIPEGSYSYEYATESEYEYVYIRSLADSDQFASYVFTPIIYPMVEICADQNEGGVISGAGKYQYGSDVVLVATAKDGYEIDGWYENNVLLSNESVLQFKAIRDYTVTIKFRRKADNWSINTENKTVTGILEGTNVDDVINHFKTDDSTVTVTAPDNESPKTVGTGYWLNIGPERYIIIVRGDVDGNAEIDIFDLYCMLDHINSTEMLTGAYFQAGCVNQNEDIDIFDVYSELEYINNGSF